MWRVLFEIVVIVGVLGTAFVAVVNVVRFVRQNRGKPLRAWFKAEPTRPCPYCRTPIPISAAVCAHCRKSVSGSDLPAETKEGPAE
ncbi:MAG: hypothetical protein A2V83_01655 [Nitrospirae bacterium RBG_16_64_22]|nr:MAG: hypothetical protein A2V83_01655 [Nitrospirae bacterium RBG_16_64_22]